jgi:hypothetical protein
MRARLIVMLASGLCLAGCGQAAESPSVLEDPAGPTIVTGSGSAAASAAAATVEVKFHSDLTWKKVLGSDISLCTHSLPEGKVYVAGNTNKGVAVSTHLGTGEYENHACVYGTPGKPEGGSLTFTGRRPTATSCWLRVTSSTGQGSRASRWTIGSIERTRFAGIPLAALDATVARPL